MKDPQSLPLPLDIRDISAAFPAAQGISPLMSEVAATDAFSKDAIAFTETASRFYADLATRLRRLTVSAPGMDIAGMVAMADHYQNRAHALTSFGHAVRCYPTMAMLARTHKVTL